MHPYYQSNYESLSRIVYTHFSCFIRILQLLLQKIKTYNTLVSVIVENAPLDPGYILQLTCRSMLYLKKYSQTSCQFMLASANMNKYIVFTWKYGFYYIASSVHSTADPSVNNRSVSWFEYYVLDMYNSINWSYTISALE